MGTTCFLRDMTPSQPEVVRCRAVFFRGGPAIFAGSSESHEKKRAFLHDVGEKEHGRVAAFGLQCGRVPRGARGCGPQEARGRRARAGRCRPSLPDMLKSLKSRMMRSRAATPFTADLAVKSSMPRAFNVLDAGNEGELSARRRWSASVQVGDLKITVSERIAQSMAPAISFGGTKPR